VRKIVAPLCVFLISFLVPTAFADIAAIHADALPQETAILAALDDARQLEPYSHSWTNNWKYPIAKEDAAARLDKDLGILSFTLKIHPGNEELALLTGLVARYAYNLDVPGSHETAISALGRAQESAPSDVRVPWFHATLLCQTNESKAGAEQMLGIESSRSWDQLPAAFWNDYLECATIANMPAHVLRAADHLEKLHAPATDARTTVTEASRKRYDAFDPNKQYDPREVWQGAQSGDDIEFTSTSCGVRFRARSDWHIERLELTKGSCVGLFRTGPYKGIVSSRTPNVLLLIQRPKENETLQEFSTKFLKDGTFSSFTPTRCPADPCIALKQEKVGMYQGDGDGHGRVVIFERNQPEFPGLIFEAPLPLAEPGDKEGMHAYHPSQIQQRMPGKLYYLVLLDTAASIEEPAMKDFDFFLQNLIAE
jgi:hypothetical protein